MEFEEKKVYENWGKKIGFMFSFLMLSTILYLVLLFFGKINSGEYIYLLVAVLIITLIGKFLKNLLK